MAYGKKTGGRQKGTPNKIRGAFARAIVAELKRRGVDLVRDFADCYEDCCDEEFVPDPKRQRVLFAALRYAEMAERAEANEADAIAEAEQEASKSADTVTTAPARLAQPIEKPGAFSKVEKTTQSLRASLLASVSPAALTGLPGLPGGPKLPQARELLAALG